MRQLFCIFQLVAEKVDEKQVDSTVIHIPTESELEEAVTSQNYDTSGAEFWYEIQFVMQNSDAKFNI